jgi:predicted amidophosphoribosyltransferase
MLELPDIPVDLKAVVRYGGAVRPLVRLLKMGNEAALEQIGQQMARLVPKGSIIIPMPTSRQKGLVLPLAQEIADNSKDADVLPSLERVKTITKSHLLRRAGRPGHDMEVHLQSMVALRLPTWAKGRRLVVVDDVITSGASMLAAERLLGRKILGVVYADASRK